MSHTQTKLRVGDKYKTDIFAGRAGHAIARTVNPQATGEDEANARRLVACWNACLGASTEFIEGLGKLDENEVSLYEKKLVSQRNELLEALKEIHKRLIKCAEDPISAAEAYDSFYQEMVCEAIKKAES